MTFTKGDPNINREGRPLGSRDFATDFDEAVDEIAKDNKITRSEARKVLFKVAYKEAKNGSYPFYKDIHDRIYGTAVNKIESNSNLDIKVDVTNPKALELANEFEQKLKETL